MSDEHELLWPVIQRLIPPSSSILEVGCGSGLIASKLTSLGHRVIAVDTYSEGIKQAESSFANTRFALHSAYDDFQSLTCPVDIVLSVEVIEHLMTPRRFLENAYRILKPGGTIILTTPYHGYWKNLALSLLDKWDAHFSVEWNDGHVKFFSERSLSTMLSSVGFNNISFHNAGRVPYLWKSMICMARKNVTDA